MLYSGNSATSKGAIMCGATIRKILKANGASDRQARRAAEVFVGADAMVEHSVTLSDVYDYVEAWVRYPALTWNGELARG